MSSTAIRRALIAVFDKSGVVEFARALHDEFGVEILSTGGTAALLAENGVPVTRVETVTGFPEMLDGRVKTLHPHVHAAILADRDNPEHLRQLDEQRIAPVDLVAVNLYAFAETIARPDVTPEQAIEMIDIGGPCLLRAAAKNHRHVLVVSRPGDYAETLDALRKEKAGTPALESLRARFAAAAFETTTQYDAQVARWLGGRTASDDPGTLDALFLRQRGSLRYGENPHQSGGLLSWVDRRENVDLAAAGAALPADTAMSFNNYLDAAAALNCCRELSAAAGRKAVSVFVKHNNPCGAGVADVAVEAYRRAYLGDVNAAMGGILAVNVEVDDTLAAAVMDSLDHWGRAAGGGAFFVEVWLAPAFHPSAVEIIQSRKPWGRRARLLPVPGFLDPDTAPPHDYRRIPGGFLCQSADTAGLDEKDWNVVTQRAPDARELSDLRMAWLVCKHTRSNAITLCRDGMLLGNGAGQMSRVMSCRIATWLAAENGHGERLRGAAAASDAFFPFADGPTMLLDAGVTALIQPGGSKRDAETIAACDERGAAMIFTGTRHFRH